MPEKYCECKGKKEFFCMLHDRNHSNRRDLCADISVETFIRISDEQSNLFVRGIAGKLEGLDEISKNAVNSAAQIMKYTMEGLNIFLEATDCKKAELNRLKNLASNKLMHEKDREIMSFLQNPLIPRENTIHCYHVLVEIQEIFLRLSQTARQIGNQSSETRITSETPRLNPAEIPRNPQSTQIKCAFINLFEEIGHFDLSFLIIGEGKAGKSTILNVIANIFLQKDLPDLLIAVKTDDFQIIHHTFLEDSPLIDPGKASKIYKFFNPQVCEKVLLFIEASEEILTEAMYYEMTQEVYNRVRKVDAIIFVHKCQEKINERVINIVQNIYSMISSVCDVNFFVISTCLASVAYIEMDCLGIRVLFHGKVNNWMFTKEGRDKLKKPEKLQQAKTALRNTNDVIWEIIIKQTSFIG